MARRRILHPEEEALWQAVARTAQPMHAPVFRRKIETDPAPAPDLPPKAPPHPRLPAFRLGEKAGNPRSGTANQPSAAPLQMDAKAFARMTRGKLTPEGRIDLHGMTLAEAHPELIHFVLKAQTQGLRLVLIITGKGKQGVDHGPIPQRAGVLRHQVPHWLRQTPLAPAILQVTEAHLRHGGSGAFYVYLRRGR
ncbi:MAG: Smr/MutS family protein [Paracoccaceae bacterium]|nr:Smr/MutS family protein [Paracoccaceae bacterium]